MENGVIYKCYFKIKKLNPILKSDFQKSQKQKKKCHNQRKLQIGTKQNIHLL